MKQGAGGRQGAGCGPSVVPRAHCCTLTNSPRRSQDQRQDKGGAVGRGKVGGQEGGGHHRLGIGAHRTMAPHQRNRCAHNAYVSRLRSHDHATLHTRSDTLLAVASRRSSAFSESIGAVILCTVVLCFVFCAVILCAFSESIGATAVILCTCTNEYETCISDNYEVVQYRNADERYTVQHATLHPEKKCPESSGVSGRRDPTTTLTCWGSGRSSI